MVLGKNEVDVLDGFADTALKVLMSGKHDPKQVGDTAYEYAKEMIKARRRAGIKADKS